MKKINNEINRKGGYLSTFFNLIIIIGCLILIFVVVEKLATRGSDATQDTLCRASVVLRGKATISLVDNLVEFEKITPLACQTKDLGRLKGSREDIKEEIADYSAKCWWEFAEGSVPDMFKVGKNEKGCFVCYTFTLEGKLDSGTPSKVISFTEPRDPKVPSSYETSISNYEMTNFLVSEVYNPGVIYGGGTKNYFGTSVTFTTDAKISNPREITPSRIRSTLVNGYVMDYSYLITPETKAEISKLGGDLQQQNIGNLFIVVADEFSSIEPSDARKIIENVGLNSNDTNYDGILIMLDLNHKTMRVHIGSSLSVLIKEYDLDSMMKNAFETADKKCSADDSKTCAVEAINAALLEVTKEVHDKLLTQNNMLTGISPKTYYYYLTNGGTTWTMMTDITSEPQQTYAITYVGSSDETAWFSTRTATYVGATAGVIAGIVLTSTGIGSAIGLPLMATSIGTMGGLAGYTAGQTVPHENIRPNNIMIMPVNELGDQCSIVK